MTNTIKKYQTLERIKSAVIIYIDKGTLGNEKRNNTDQG